MFHTHTQDKSLNMPILLKNQTFVDQFTHESKYASYCLLYDRGNVNENFRNAYSEISITSVHKGAVTKSHGG